MDYTLTFKDNDPNSNTYGHETSCVYNSWELVEKVIAPLVEAKFIVSVKEGI